MRYQNALELNSFNSGLVKVLLICAAIALAIDLVGAALIGLGFTSAPGSGHGDN